MATIREILLRTRENLEAAGIHDARLESEVMVMNVMRMPRQDLFAHQEDGVNFQQEQGPIPDR